MTYEKEASPTVLAYMAHPHQLTDTAMVMANEDNGCLVLDRTLFYPQGGGQACDVGKIVSPSGTFLVKDVRFLEGVVHHYGTLEQGAIAVGQNVQCEVDRDRRHINSRLHSAGHLLDEAVKNLKLGWIPTKGIHYFGQAAVEYSGQLENLEAVKSALEAEIRRLVDAGGEISSNVVSISELSQVVDFIPERLPENKPVRVVKMGAGKGTPCGGTHVANVADIGYVTVRYIKTKKGNIKVAYELQD